MLEQAQSIRLVNLDGQTEYKRDIKKKEHGTRRLPMCPMQHLNRRVLVSPAYSMSFCFSLLELDWTADFSADVPIPKP